MFRYGFNGSIDLCFGIQRTSWAGRKKGGFGFFRLHAFASILSKTTKKI